MTDTCRGPGGPRSADCAWVAWAWRLTSYAPGRGSARAFEAAPPTSTGATRELFPGRYRWTRGGLKGIDFGAEVTNAR